MHYKKTTIECFALFDIDAEGAAALHEQDMNLTTHDGDSIYAIEDVIAECDRHEQGPELSRLRDKLAILAIESLTPVKILMGEAVIAEWASPIFVKVTAGEGDFYGGVVDTWYQRLSSTSDKIICPRECYYELLEANEKAVKEKLSKGEGFRLAKSEYTYLYINIVTERQYLESKS